MKVGKNDAETLRLNGWGVGDVIERETYRRDVIQLLITAIGEEEVLVRPKLATAPVFGAETVGHISFLTDHPWRRVQEKAERGAPVKVPDLGLVPMESTAGDRNATLPDVDKDRSPGIPFTCKGSTPE